MNPLHTFKTWYDTQTAEVRSQIAFMVVPCLADPTRGEMPLSDLLQPEEPFIDWLTEPVSNPWQVLGRVLSLRELVGFLVMRSAATQDDWDESIERNKKMLSYVESKGEGEFTDKIRAMINEMPRRATLWISVANEWRKFRNSSLSDEAIEAWFQRDRDTPGTA